MKKATGLILLTSLAMAPAAFSAPAGTLSVHILNQQTGIPSPNVTVTLEKSSKTAGSRWLAVKRTKTGVSNLSIHRTRICCREFTK